MWSRSSRGFIYRAREGACWPAEHCSTPPASAVIVPGALGVRLSLFFPPLLLSRDLLSRRELRAAPGHCRASLAATLTSVSATA